MGELILKNSEGEGAREIVSKELGIEATDLGARTSFRHRLLMLVLNEDYDEGLSALKDFMETPSLYANFHDRIRRYMNHATDLIYAIRAKRNFPGMSSLTRAKQQELKEKYKHHFRELNQILKSVERVERDLEVLDARSTMYVIRAAWICTIFLILVAFLIEFFSGVALSGWIVFNDGVAQFVDWIFQKI